MISNTSDFPGGMTVVSIIIMSERLTMLKKIGEKYSDTMGFSQIVRSLDSVTIFNTKLPSTRAH